MCFRANDTHHISPYTNTFSPSKWITQGKQSQERLVREKKEESLALACNSQLRPSILQWIISLVYCRLVPAEIIKTVLSSPQNSYSQPAYSAHPFNTHNAVSFLLFCTCMELWFIIPVSAVTQKTTGFSFLIQSLSKFLVVAERFSLACSFVIEIYLHIFITLLWIDMYY